MVLSKRAGCQKNRVEAARLFNGAAAGGSPEAAFKWAESLYYGYGVEKNRQEAEKWYQYAVEHKTAWTPEKEKSLRLASFAMFCMQWFAVPLILLLALMVSTGNPAIHRNIHDYLDITVFSILFFIGPLFFVLGVCGYCGPAKWGAVFMGGLSIYAFAWLVWTFGPTLFGFVVVLLMYGRIGFFGVKVSSMMGQKAYWLERQRTGHIISFRTPIVVCTLVFAFHGIHLVYRYLFAGP